MFKMKQDTCGCWPRITNIKNTHLCWIPGHQTLSVSTLKLSHVSRLGLRKKEVEQSKAYDQDFVILSWLSVMKNDLYIPQHSLIIN